MGKKKNILKDDLSSDDEELFSYLTMVQKCNNQKPNTNNSDNKIDKITEADKIKSVENTENRPIEINASIEQQVVENESLNTKIPYDVKESKSFKETYIVEEKEKLNEKLRAEKGETSSHKNQNAVDGNEAETVKDNKENPNTNNLDNKIHKNAEVDEIIPVENSDNSCVINSVSVEKRVECLDPKMPFEVKEIEIDKEGYSVEEIKEPSKNDIAEKLGTSFQCLDTKIPYEVKESQKEGDSVEEMEELSRKIIAEKEKTNFKENNDMDCVDIKQDSGSQGKRDKYYLINEKDWLTLCAKIDNAENVGNIKRKNETVFKDSSEKMVLQESIRPSSGETKSPNGKGKSLFSVFKKYNPISKSHLKETDSIQSVSNFSPKKQKLSVSIRSRKQIGKPSDQLISQEENELSERILSRTSEVKASPNVEIVYIRLEDGNIRYDVNKSTPPAKNTDATNLSHSAVRKIDFCQQDIMHGVDCQEVIRVQTSVPDNKPSIPLVKNTDLNAIRKIDFCEQDTMHGVDSQEHIRVHTSVSDNNNIECIDLLSDDQGSNKPDCNFGNSNTVLSDPLNTNDPTRCEMQVRFVRINNKLTRVYENVKHNVIDEVLDASDHNQNEKQSHCKAELEFAQDDVDGSDNDSFNFDDSQLVAFPLNAFDPENINKDDSLPQLTPSKLDILNTSCNMDPLTPSKLHILSQAELHHLTPHKLEWSSPIKLDFSPPCQLDIIPTGDGDVDAKESYSKNNLSLSNRCSADPSEEPETPIILKVTKSGALVQCKRHESSPLKVENISKTTSCNTTENVKKSLVQNIWKTFKPVQQKTKRKDLSMSAYEDSQFCTYRSGVSYKVKNDSDSDEDELTAYFLSSNNSNKDSGKVNECSDLSEKKLLEPNAELCDEKKLERGAQLDSSNGRKMENVKVVNKKSRKTVIEETNVTKTVRNTNNESKMKPNGSHSATGKEICSINSSTEISKGFVQSYIVVSPKINKDSSVPLSDRTSQMGRKRKGTSRYNKDCVNKQVDFKDFETESREVCRKRKINVDSKSEETVDHQVISNTSILEETPRKLSGIEQVKMPLKKRKVKTDEISEKSELIQDAQGKSHGSVKKSCAKLETSKQKKISEEKKETKLKKTLDSVEVMHGNESQKKIEFLENCIVKIKEASAGVSAGKSNVLESPSKVCKIDDTYDKPNNNFDDNPEVKTEQNETRVKKPPAEKRNMKKLDGVSNTFSVNDKEQVSKELGNSSKCRRNENKSKDFNKKHNSKLGQNIVDNGIKSNLNEHCFNGKEARPEAMIKSPKATRLRSRGRRQDTSSGIVNILIDRQKLEKESKPRSNAGSNSKSQRKRKKSQVLPAKDEITTKLLNNDQSSMSVNASVVENKITKNKPKCLKNSKSREDERVIVTDKECGAKGLVQSEAVKGQDHPSVDPKNKEKQKTKNKSQYKRAPQRSKNTRVVKCKNIQLNTSSSMDDLDTNVKSEKCVSESVVVVSPDSELLNSDKGIDSDCKKHGTIVSILATFQPLQGEESTSDGVNSVIKCEDSPLTRDAENKNDSQGKRNEMKLDKEKNEISLKKIKRISKGSDKNVSKRKQKIVNDMKKTKTYKNKVSKDMPSSGEESLDEKDSIEHDDKVYKIASPKLLRTGKIKKVNNSRDKGLLPKPLKSARKPYTRSKLKSTSRRKGKESWKDLLDDDTVTLDINDVAIERHKPVNVRHVIRNILKTAQGKEKTHEIAGKHVRQSGSGRQRERKEKSHRYDKSSSSNSQILTSESDDAWMSDSGQGTSFPAFQFTSGSDSETGKKALKVLGNDNRLRNTSKPATNWMKNVTDGEHCAQKYIELHHSPVKVSGLQEMINVNDSSVNSVSDAKFSDSKTIESPVSTKGSPEMKKNLDKLIAILDKVSEHKVVKNLEFKDNVSS